MIQDDLAQQFLDKFSLQLKTGWCEAAINILKNDPSSLNKAKEQLLQILFGLFLESDMHTVGVGCLPADLKTWHTNRLVGRFVLQSDEVVNIAAAAKERYKEAQRGRCLKLRLTDGVQQVSALEYSYIPALHVHQPAGTKIAVTDAEVRKGMLILQPENILILGGQVESMEAARQRMLERWHQPPGGRTQRDENQAPTDLYHEAAEAAWRQPQQHADGRPASPAQAPQAAHHQPAQAQHPSGLQGGAAGLGAGSRAAASAEGVTVPGQAGATHIRPTPPGHVAAAQQVFPGARMAGPEEARLPLPAPSTGRAHTASPPQPFNAAREPIESPMSMASARSSSSGGQSQAGERQSGQGAHPVSPAASMQLDDEYWDQASPDWYSPASPENDFPSGHNFPSVAEYQPEPHAPEAETIVISDSSDSETGKGSRPGDISAEGYGPERDSRQQPAAPGRRHVVESSSDEAEPALLRKNAGEGTTWCPAASGSAVKAATGLSRDPPPAQMPWLSGTSAQSSFQALDTADAELAPRHHNGHVPSPHGHEQAGLGDNRLAAAAPQLLQEQRPQDWPAASQVRQLGAAHSPDTSPDTVMQYAEAGPSMHTCNGAEMPVTSVLELINRTATAAESDFPIEACLQARITACKSRLTVVGDPPDQQFSLSVEIRDDTMSCEVHLHHSILQDLLGMGVQELVATADKRQPLSRMQKLVKGFNGLMVVQISNPIAKPVVVNLGSADM